MIFCLSLFLWLISINPFPDFFAVLPAIYLIGWNVVRPAVIPLREKYSPLLIFFLCAYCGLLGAYQIVQYLAADQGVDFAMFSQVINSIAHKGIPETSLLELRWINFLTHHFSPIWYLPGAVTFFGLAAPYSGIFFHVVSMAGMIWSTYLIARELKFDKVSSLALTCVIFMHPALRVGLSWEIREEVLAMPFIGFAYLFLLRERILPAFACIFVCFLCKENFFLEAGLIPLAFLPGATRQRKFIYFIPLIAGITAWILYFKIFPGWLFFPTFDLNSRFPGLRVFYSVYLDFDKLTWFLNLVGPFFFLPLYLRKGWAWTLPALPVIVAICLTNFWQMLNPTNYYAIMPAFILGLSSLRALSESKILIPDLRLLTLSLIVSLGLASSRLPLKETILSREKISLTKELREHIPDNAIVVAEDRELSPFWYNQQSIRFIHARKNRANFTHVVIAKGRELFFPRYLMFNSKVCFENSYWIVRCKI
jgi:uncharacterized membrane protein